MSELLLLPTKCPPVRVQPRSGNTITKPGSHTDTQALRFSDQRAFRCRCQAECGLNAGSNPLRLVRKWSQRTHKACPRLPAVAVYCISRAVHTPTLECDVSCMAHTNGEGKGRGKSAPQAAQPRHRSDVCHDPHTTAHVPPKHCKAGQFPGGGKSASPRTPTTPVPPPPPTRGLLPKVSPSGVHGRQGARCSTNSKGALRKD